MVLVALLVGMVKVELVGRAVEDVDSEDSEVEDVTLVGVGKLNVVLVLATSQNCCARLSAVPSSVGHMTDMHETNAGANFLLCKYRY